MKLIFGLLGLLIGLALAPPGTVAADEAGGDYIKVEIKGTLRTGLMAIGGETTGTVIEANNVTWELDVRHSTELQETARNLDKKKVLVTGTYQKTRGVEIRERHIVKVATLKAAP